MPDIYPSVAGADHRLTVGVVGCGRWGMNYLRVLRELPNVADVVAFDMSPQRLDTAVASFPGLRTTTDARSMAEAADIDAVIVCTPASTHFAAAAPLLEAGKSVLIEKPMTTRMREARALIDLAEDAGVTLSVGHTFLHNAAVHKVKEYIDAGDIGNLYYLYSRRTNLGPIRSDVSVMWDLAPHDISIFNLLLDDRPLWVSAVGVPALESAHPDVGFASLGYPNGVVAHLHVSWVDPFKVRELVVVGSSLRIVFDDLKASEPVRVYEKGVTPLGETNPGTGEFPHLVREGDIISPAVAASEPLKNQVVDFLDSVAGGIPSTAGGEVGLSIVAVVRALERSVELGGAPVHLDYGAARVSARSGVGEGAIDTSRVVS